MRTRPTTAILVAVVMAGVAAGAIAVSGADDTRQREVRERGTRVMPFSLDATTHFFDAAADGGVQRVVAKDPADREEIRLIREHLREEAAAFRRGDFGDPAAIHGDDMPGLRELSEGHGRIDVRYDDLPDGARLTYETSDPALARAVQTWFEAQLSDHGKDASGGHAGHE